MVATAPRNHPGTARPALTSPAAYLQVWKARIMTRREIACPHCHSTRVGLITTRLGYALRCLACTFTREIW